MVNEDQSEYIVKRVLNYGKQNKFLEILLPATITLHLAALLQLFALLPTENHLQTVRL